MKIEWAIAAMTLSTLFGSVSGGVRKVTQDQGSVRVFSNLSYGSGAVGQPKEGTKDLLLDLYTPAGGGEGDRFPAIVLLHGGGFRRGNKEGTIGELAWALASRGVLAVSINYRLVGDAPPGEGRDELRRVLSAAGEDAGKALAWMRQNASRYRIDSRRIAVGGSSAGAITALFVAYGKSGASPVGAVVDLWGGMYGEERLIQKGAPPLLIVHGSLDRTVPFQLGLDLKARCQEVGVPFEFHAVNGAGHGFAAIAPSSRIDGRDLVTVVVDFLKANLADGR